MPDQSAAPLTVPVRPLPEASVTVLPEAASSLYQRARPSVTSAAGAASAAWAGAVGAASPRNSDAAVSAASRPARRLARTRTRAVWGMSGSLLRHGGASAVGTRVGCDVV